MGNTLKRILVTVPLAIALAGVGMAGTAQAATPAAAPARAAAASPVGYCYLYANGVLQWEFVARAANCISEAARVQALYPFVVISYVWYPLA